MDFLPKHNNIPDLKKQEQEKQKNIEEIILRYLSGWAIHIIASSSTGNRTPVSAVRGRRLNRLTIEPYRTLLQYTLALTKKQAFFCILFKLFNLCIFYIIFRQFNFGTRGQTPVPAHGTGVSWDRGLTPCPNSVSR